MPIQQVIESKHVPVKIWTNEVEDEARDQLVRTASLPFVHHHVAAMPDVHYSIGATVGSVVATVGAVVPASVGVDIGCGMVAIKLRVKADQLPDNLGELRSAIEAAVPHGRTANGGHADRGAWGEPPEDVAGAWQALDDERWARIRSIHGLTGPKTNSVRHLGTLGTGNHFIEVCVDKKEQDVWVMLHSGSRGIGNRIGSYFIGAAKEEMAKFHINLDDKDLAYLPEKTALFDAYIDAVSWAQDFARLNRNIMMRKTLEQISRILKWDQPTDYMSLMAVNCHHNYVSREYHYGKSCLVTRKGAVRAGHGDLGVIPGSMGAKSFIVRGKGNAESFNSCSHGAGRRMSRTTASKTFSIRDLEEQTVGVECRKDAGVIDEIPQAYKDIDAIMAYQTDLVEVVAEIKQVLCVKG